MELAYSSYTWRIAGQIPSCLEKVITLNKSSHFYDICVKIKGRLTLSRRSALPSQEYEAAAVAVSNEKQVWLIRAV